MTNMKTRFETKDDIAAAIKVMRHVQEKYETGSNWSNFACILTRESGFEVGEQEVVHEIIEHILSHIAPYSTVSDYLFNLGVADIELPNGKVNMRLSNQYRVDMLERFIKELS